MNNWQKYLEARRDLINEFRTEGKSCTEIAQILTMDPGQVWLISQVEEGKPVPEDAQKAIMIARDRAMAVLSEMPGKGKSDTDWRG